MTPSGSEELGSASSEAPIPMETEDVDTEDNVTEATDATEEEDTGPTKVTEEPITEATGVTEKEITEETVSAATVNESEVSKADSSSEKPDEASTPSVGGSSESVSKKDEDASTLAAISSTAAAEVVTTEATKEQATTSADAITTLAPEVMTTLAPEVTTVAAESTTQAVEVSTEGPITETTGLKIQGEVDAPPDKPVDDYDDDEKLENLPVNTVAPPPEVKESTDELPDISVPIKESEEEEGSGSPDDFISSPEPGATDSRSIEDMASTVSTSEETEEGSGFSSYDADFDLNLRSTDDYFSDSPSVDYSLFGKMVLM